MKSTDMAYDVIVVGLGPGGSSTARDLAARGVRVLGLDRARFPRHKPCGGCLSLKIEGVLDPDFKSLIEREIYGVTFRFKDGKTIYYRDRTPAAYMITRSRLDTYLLEKARQAGAEIREGEKAKAVVSNGKIAEVITDQGRYQARIVVGADGANSVVARSAGLPHRGWKAVLIEGEVSIPSEALGTLTDEVIMEFGTIPFGYGWIFPKADHLSIGVGGLQRKIGNPKPYYQEFLHRHRILEEIRAERRYGHTLPVYSRRRPVSRGNILLVGDAAGLVDPFIGEGIYYAIRSGQAAAEVILDALSDTSVDLSRYDLLIDQKICCEFREARRLALFVYYFPDIFSRLASRGPDLLREYFEVIRGKQTYICLNEKVEKKMLKELLIYVGLFRVRSRDVSGTYDRIAPHYDSYGRLWHFFCRDIYRSLKDLIHEVTPTGAVVLDAGGGTGATTAMVLSETRAARVDLLDLSKEMIRVARNKLKDPHVHFIRGDITRLPYPDQTFDLVISTWAIETLEDPKAAVREFLRVIKDDGFVIYAFSSLPERGIERFGAFLVEMISGGKFAFRFLPPWDRPYHRCAMSRLVTFFGGAMTLVVLRKCCTVEDEAAPCLLPESWGGVLPQLREGVSQ